MVKYESHSNQFHMSRQRRRYCLLSHCQYADVISAAIVLNFRSKVQTSSVL